MAKPKVLISMLVDDQTQAEPFGRALLQFLFGEKELRPEFAGNWEPVSNPVSDWQEAMAYYNENSFLWLRRHAIVSSGDVRHNSVFGSASIRLESVYGSSFDWFGFFRRLVSLTSPSYGYLHVFTEAERIATRLTPENLQYFYLGALSKTLERGLLELGWCNYFGPKWLNSINADKLERDERHVELFNQGVLLRLTDEISDVVNRYSEFALKRDSARPFFAKGMFYTD